jgi:cellulose synthase/poly-beta-1,6-N-acetylglucosamine synthase-like glycosyltransferase
MIVVQIIFVLLYLYLAAGIIYLLVIAVAGRFGHLPVYRLSQDKKRIALLIPSYKEDNVIIDTARKAAAHNYPTDKFTVLVIADKLKPETVAVLRAIPVQVLEVDVNMKSRSLNAALHFLSESDYDIAMILDADNIMEDGCLEKVNDAFQHGCKAVQCHRTAKNQHTAVALLDAISEEININLFRRGPAVLNISAAPIGSGMAFTFGLLKEIFTPDHILNNPGEDREIDMQLMKKNIRMQFIDGAYIYDEKVASAGVFEKQRVRWLEAQVNHFKRFFDEDMKDCPRSVVYYNKLFQNILLPRLLFIMVLGLLFMLVLAQWIFGFAIMQLPSMAWLSLLLLYALVLFLSVPGRFYSAATMRAVAQVPVLMLSMIKALLKVKSGRKEFLHTPKTFHSDK